MLIPAYDAAPPIAAPFRFFLSMPLFGVLFGLALLLVDPVMLQTRWNWPVLALTHLLTLGLLAQPMLGALVQMLPVVAGVSLPRPLWLARWSHGLLTAGSLSLVAGFWLMQPLGLQAAAVMLPLALLPFALLAVRGLLRSSTGDATTRMMLLALLALLLTVLLGLLLLGHLGWGRGLDALRLTNLHGLWGGMGWVLGLVVGIAFTVVPMFQMTPRYPAQLEKTALAAWSLLLLALSAALWFLPESAAPVTVMLLLPGSAGFAAVTLWLQRQSRRASDVTLRFWMLAMLSLGVAAVLPLAAPWWPRAGLLAGALFLFGFAVSVVNGMLYKIVPFLVWLHLQRINQRRFAIPNMKQILAETAQRRQLWLHTAALLLLLQALAWPTRPGCVLAGVAVIAAQLWLGWNLLGAARLYRTTAARIRSAPPA